MLKLSPINQRRWQRFKENKQGYYCFLIFSTITFLALIAELFFNNRALLVRYQGETYFPFFQGSISAETYGMAGKAEPNYLELQKEFEQAGQGNWVLMPFIPYSADTISDIDWVPLDKNIALTEEKFLKLKGELNASVTNKDELTRKLYELDLQENQEKGKFERLKYHPLPPDSKHYLGTDEAGRDIFSRLVYGYRVAIYFALVLLVINYLLGVSVGCMMGYFGGVFDLIVQRVIEVINNIPFLYIIIIIAALLRQNGLDMGFWTLVGIYVLFGWVGMTWYMRTAVYKEKSRDYIWAAKAMGASTTSIIFNHLLPNVVSLLVTFMPFSISGAIVGLTSLDYLGYGMPKGTPSWGELIRMGTEDMNSYWIVLSVVSAMVLVLYLINAVGEAIREAFDPKKISKYE
jgi:microcin C transport system permease protein